MNKKTIWIAVGIIVVVVVILVATLSGGSNKTVAEKQTIKIGFIAPLTGNASYLGEGVKNAAQLALADLQKKNTKYNYEIVFEDDAFSPAKTASAANKLISIDGVDAIATVASAAGSAANPIAESNRVVHIGIASDPNIAKGTYNFIDWTPPAKEVKLFIQEAQKKGIKKIAIFGQKISGITAVFDELKKQIPGTGIEIVAEDISNFGDKDFRTAIQKAQAANPDYFLFCMFSPELEIITKQIRDARINIPMTAIESFELSDNPGLFEGLWYVNAADPTPAFANAYQAAYGKNPTVATPNAYDIVGLVARAAESYSGKGKPSTTDIANALAQTRGYNGALGNGISVGPDHIVVTDAVLRIIKDGKPVTIQP